MDDPRAFPVAMVREDGAWVARTEAELTTMHRTIIAATYRGVLIDSQGRLERITGAEEDRPNGCWARFRQSWQHSAPVKLTFAAPAGQISLDDCKTMLIAALSKRPRMVQSFQGLDRYEAFLAKTADASTFAEVFGLLRDFDTIPRELL